MTRQSEKAILLALRVILNTRPSPKAKEAAREVTKALEQMGVEMPENESGW